MISLLFCCYLKFRSSHAYADPIAEAQSFCGAVMASVDPAFKARLMQQSQQPTLN